MSGLETEPLSGGRMGARVTAIRTAEAERYVLKALPLRTWRLDAFATDAQLGLCLADSEGGRRNAAPALELARQILDRYG